MRDVVAALVAAALIFAALSLLTTLHFYRLRHRRAREAETARGRSIVVELPTDPELTLITEDADHFYFGSRPIAKADIMAARVLINGSPIAACVSPHFQPADRMQPTTFEDRPDGIARDRWDVAIETREDTILVECGAIRERVSQELARKIFDAVRATIPPQADRRDG
jgi:hypothetical protein